MFRAKKKTSDATLTEKVPGTNGERGIALLVTLFAVMIMTFLAIEIAYNSQVEFAVGSNQVDRLRAYYLAKTGVQFSLLRIQVYKTAMSRFGSQLGNQKSALDLIWQFPFTWPPLQPPDLSRADKDNIKKVLKDSFIENTNGSLATLIEGEGGKINVNDLGSPSDILKKQINTQLVQLIQNRMNVDDDWARDHRNLRPQEIVNAIADWVTTGTDSLNGGAKSSYYQDTDPPIVPPGRPMKTLSELHMVKGVTDDVYNILEPKLTIYGLKGVNVNLASSEVLQSIDKQITKDIADQIIEHRNDPNFGPYPDLNTFVSFIQTRGVNVQTFNKNPEINLLFDSESNFRIRSTGIYKKAQREIVAVVYDFDKVKGQLASELTAGSSASPGASAGASAAGSAQPSAGVSPSPSPSNTGNPSNGPPSIVLWQEF